MIYDLVTGLAYSAIYFVVLVAVVLIIGKIAKRLSFYKD